MGTRIVSVLMCAGLGACAASPVPVIGQPGPQKSPVAFQADEAACRQQAATEAGPAGTANSNVRWSAFFAAYGKCQEAKGNRVMPVPWDLAYAAYLGGVLPFAGPPPLAGPAYYGPPGAWGYGYP